MIPESVVTVLILPSVVYLGVNLSCRPAPSIYGSGAWYPSLDAATGMLL